MTIPSAESSLALMTHCGHQAKAAVFVQPGNVDAKYADSHKSTM